MVLNAHILLAIIILLLLCRASCTHCHVDGRHLEKFFRSVDQGGDGEIRHNEAKEFLDSLGGKESKRDYYGYGDTFLDSLGGKENGDTASDLSLSCSFTFTYGGASICAGEMLGHLQNVLTSDRVAEWIAHGLQLPEYASAFYENEVTGLDFPALIENEGLALAQALGVQNVLHRNTIIQAVVRHIFGVGVSPGQPQDLSCEYSPTNGILLRWSPPSSRGHPPLHKYIVERWEKVSSTWVSKDNSTKGTTFLDRIESNHDTWLSYRVQAWGVHGPSEWVTLHGCAVLHSQETGKVRSEQLAYEEWAKETPLWMGLGLLFRIYILNLMVIILGILARCQSFCGYFVALWNFLDGKVFRGTFARFSQGGNFGFPVVVMKVTHHIYLAWTKVYAISKTSSRREVENPSNKTRKGRVSCSDGHTDLEASEAIRSMHVTSGNTRTRVDSTPCLSNIYSIARSRQVPQDPHCISAPASMTENWAASYIVEEHEKEKSPRVGGLTRSFDDLNSSAGDRAIGTKKKHVKLIEAFGGSFGAYYRYADPQTIYRSSDTRDMLSSSRCHSAGRISMELHNREVPWEGSLRARSESYRLPSLSVGHSTRRRRCNYEGCKSRYDRFLSLSDWRMKLNRHYCCHCQLLYCVEHTCFCPHGLLGRCGLDSICVCMTCFEGMPLETKERHLNFHKSPSSSQPFGRLLALLKGRKKRAKEGCKMLESSWSAESLPVDSSSRPAAPSTDGCNDEASLSTTSQSSCSL